MKIIRAAFILIVVAGLVAVGAQPADAHAFPASETPPAGATLDSSPPRVAITYDAPIEDLFAKLQVVSDSGVSVTSGTPSLSDDRRTLSVALKPVAPGDYTVKWSVVAEDGHRTEGAYQFTVAGGAGR